MKELASYKYRNKMDGTNNKGSEVWALMRIYLLICRGNSRKKLQTDFTATRQRNSTNFRFLEQVGFDPRGIFLLTDHPFSRTPRQPEHPPATWQIS